jgi:glycosyltransferase involved in cell wall biosynthesis
LYNCLESINNQTKLPDEVVVSLSDLEDLEEEIIKKEVDNKILCFQNLKIKIIYTTKKLFTGENRNIAIENSNGDIICLIDADDRMFKNKIDFTTKIFENLKDDCVCILHNFSRANCISVKEDAKFNINSIKDIDENNHSRVHYAHGAFRREVFNEHKYSIKGFRGEDREFILRIMSFYRERIKLYCEPLSYYQQQYSTHTYRKKKIQSIM